MEISIKDYNQKLLRIFDTDIDKKKEIIITTVSDLQKNASIELYLNKKKHKKYLIKNLIPVKAGLVNIKIILEFEDDKLTLSYLDHDNYKNNHIINLSFLNLKKQIFHYLPYVPLLLLIPLFIFIGLRFFKGIPKKTNNVINIIKQKEDTQPQNKKNIPIQNETAKIKETEIIKTNPEKEKVMENPYSEKTLKEIIAVNTPIFFVENKSELLENEINKVNNITKYLNNYSKVSLTIEGHTESIGKPDNEYMLSIRRAEYIKRMIESKVKNVIIDIKINGNGANLPAAPSAKKSDRYLNRRVEIKILSAINN